MTHITPGKTELRQRLITLRQGLMPEQRSGWDAAIGNRLTAWLAARAVRTLGVYWPIRAEPDLRECYADWAARGIRLALPVVIDKNTPLKFLPWAPGEALVKDGMGVMVPASGTAAVQPDAVLIPCVGFTAERYRLGYGAGFYDRTLAASPRPMAIGVAYSCLRAEFATALHDMALDAIATEESLF